MGGKRASGRSNSGETMHPRISSAGSAKGFTIESASIINGPSQRKDADADQLSNELVSFRESLNQSSPDNQRKSSFDIISLLENQEDEISRSENEIPRRSENSSELPSFWHFVEPEANTPDFLQRPIHYRHTNQDMNNGAFANAYKTPLAETLQIGKVVNPKRSVKRRKMKKVQSAKAASGIQTLGRLRKENREWLRVLTPPGTGSSSFDSVNNDTEEDELIRRYFSGLSSAGSSISWAEDAVESEFTTQLMKLWEDIETVCAGGDRPERMSDAVYKECMYWKKAFPNPDLHRFSRNGANVSSPGSPTLALDEEQRGDAEAAFSSLVQSLSPRSTGVRRSHDDSMNQLQANFRSLNCSTPRPNIEKSTEYVSAWLSECQNSCVPEENRSLLDYRNDRPVFPAHQAINSMSQLHCESLELQPSSNSSAHPSRLVADSTEKERTSYSHYSRSHAKLINEPDPNNFFTSLAITNNEIYNPLESKITARFGVGTPVGPDINNLPFGMPRFSNTNSYQSKINESDEDEEDGSNTPTEIVSFRQNVRVQRPISSRVRDHAITPIATGSNVHSSFGTKQQHGISVNKHTTLMNAHTGENYRSKGRLRLFDNLNDTSTVATSTSAKPEGGNTGNRIKSGFVRQGHGWASHLGRSKQQPWSRHSGDDLTAEANYVTSLYENYSGGLGNRGNEEGMLDFANTSATGPNPHTPPRSAKDHSMRYFERSSGNKGSHSLTECEDGTFRHSVSWLMNR